MSRDGSSDRDHPTITCFFKADDGYPAFAMQHAAVVCSRCGKDGGWRQGTVCPFGCGVALVDVQAEETAKLMDRLREEDAERKRDRAERKARREHR